MVRNRARILQEAGRLFREDGFDAVTVADVMRAAGLTHGGFYGHFESKDELIAAVVADSLKDNAAGLANLGAWIDAYLSPIHRDAPADGCPTASMAGLMRQQTPAARAAMAEGIERQLACLAAAIPGHEVQRRRAAIGQWSALVGAIVLSRAVGDAPLADELLSETRDWLHDVSEDPKERDRDPAVKIDGLLSP